MIERRAPADARAVAHPVPAFLARLRTVADGQSVEGWSTFLALAGIVALTLRRWIILGPYPPGLDGAQWLAIGRGFHGFGRSTEGAYAPLVPLLVTIADAVVGPLPAVRLVAALSGLALSLAVWLAARGVLGSFWALLVATLVVPASALAEPLLYGGYPQQFALAAGAVMLWASCRFLVDGRVRNLWLASPAALAAAAAHHVFYPILLISMVIASVLWLSTWPMKLPWLRIRTLAVALVPSFAVFAAVALVFFFAGYSAPLGASARTVIEGWRYATRESPALWGVILAIGIVSLAAAWKTRGDPSWLLPTALIVPSALLFLISGQPRLLPPVIIGAGLAAGLGVRRLAANGGYARFATIALAITLAAALAGPADRAVVSFAHFYEVLDTSLVGAASAIATDDAAGTVAVRQDRRGWPVGWWFEALLEQPVIVGSDRQWLAFPDEWERARQADALFDGGLAAAAFHEQAAASGVRYLVIPKWDWIGWERWLREPGFPVSVLYDDDRTLVLRVN